MPTMANLRVSLVLLCACLCLPVVVVLGQQNCGTSRRRAWRDLSCGEQREYLEAVEELKDRGIYDELVYVHWDSQEESHGVPEFLPWHRWFLWIFEKELQRVSGTCMTVPYWDWERGDHDIVLKSWTFGSEGRSGCVENGISRDWNPAQPDRDCLWRDFDDDFDISRDAEVLSRITNFEHFLDFGPALEGSPHSGIHEWIGGSMARNWSPDDPLFWLHHSNVDRIWTLWQDYWGHDEIASPSDFDQRHFSGSIDRPLTIVQGEQVDFDVPLRNRPPTPRELLTNVGGLVDVQYVRDNLARLLFESSGEYRNGGNNRDWISAADERVEEQCQGNPWDEPEQVQWQLPQVVVDVPDAESEQSMEQGVEQRACITAGKSCEMGDSCCNGFCSQQTLTCNELCHGPGLPCDDNVECCSGNCHLGGCDIKLSEQSVSEEREEESVGGHEQPICADNGSACASGQDCCSDFCSRRGTCARLCFGRGSSCDSDNECCSGSCGANARCERRFRRDIEEIEVVIKDEPLVFSDPKLKARWYDLITDFPDDPARLWGILARLDGDDRASAARHDIKSASSEWIDIMKMENELRAFDCHFAR